MLRFGGSKTGNPIRKVKVTVWTPNQFTRFHPARQTYVRHCSCFAIKMLQIQPDIKGKLLNCQHYYLKLSRFHQDHVRFDFYETLPIGVLKLLENLKSFLILKLEDSGREKKDRGSSYPYWGPLQPIWIHERILCFMKNHFEIFQ